MGTDSRFDLSFDVNIHYFFLTGKPVTGTTESSAYCTTHTAEDTPYATDLRHLEFTHSAQ